MGQSQVSHQRANLTSDLRSTTRPAKSSARWTRRSCQSLMSLRSLFSSTWTTPSHSIPSPPASMAPIPTSASRSFFETASTLDKLHASESSSSALCARLRAKPGSNELHLGGGVPDPILTQRVEVLPRVWLCFQQHQHVFPHDGE